MSALSANDRLAAIAAIIVTITGVISLAWAWGVLMLLPVLAGLGVLFIVFQSRIAPAMKLPMNRGLLLFALGGIAALIWVVVTFQWIGYILEPPIFTVDTIQFLIGLVGAVLLAFAGWRAYQADAGTAAAPPAPPSAPTEPPPA